MTMTSGVARRVQERIPANARRAAHDQAVVAGGQVAAGLGNMAFALVMARLLVPGAFAQLASFLALYSLLSLPGSSISAVASLRPQGTHRARRLTLLAGVAAGALLAATSPVVGPFLRLPVVMVVVLGLSGPALGTLALERGRLYGVRGHVRLVASLVTEPAVRLMAGVLLATTLGAFGGALGVVIAGYGALEIARRAAWPRLATRAARRRLPGRRPGIGTRVADRAAPRHEGEVDGHEAVGGEVVGGEAADHGLIGERGFRGGDQRDGWADDVLLGDQALPAEPAEPVEPGGRVGAVTTGSANRRALTWTAAVFLLLTVVQNQDLLIANRVLTPAAAGQFAVLSTLGGMAAFATLTVPLVLLPRTARGDRTALLPALGLTGLIGGAVLLVAVAVPGMLVGALFGARYRPVTGVVAPYILAMALLGVARVLAAHRCAGWSGEATAAVIAAGAAIQAILIVEFGNNPAHVAFSTLTATAAVTVVLAASVVVNLPAVRRQPVALAAWSRAVVPRCREALGRPEVRVLVAACVVGTALRFVVPRGLWLDEATSVHQATLSFGGMIRDLRTTDVHPPLYFAVLWGTVRVLGTSQLAVRVPSIIAGVLTIPALYALGKEAYDRRTGAVAAGIAMVAPILVWYSQEARMYSMLALFGIIAMWAQVRILKRGPDAGRMAWVVYTIATVAMIWTQYFGLLQFAVQQLAFVWMLVVRLRRGQPARQLLVAWLVSVAVVMVAIVPLMPFAYHQFVVNQNAGKGFGAPQQVSCSARVCGNGIGVYTVLANVIWAVIGYQPTATMLLLGALWPLGMLISLASLGRRSRSVTALLVAGVLGPGVLAFVLGVMKPYLFDIRYLFPAVALVTVLVARGLTGFVGNRRVLIAVTGVVIAALSAFLVNQQVNGSNPRRYDFNTALQAIDRQDHHGDVLLYSPGDLNLLVEYYSPHVTARPMRAHPQLPTGQHTEWVLVSRSLQAGADHATTARGLAYLRHHSRLVGRRTYANVEVWEFR